MNKKQIYILSLLLSLMVVLILMQRFFLEDIRKVAMRNNGVKKFSEYKLKQGEYKILLPIEWSEEEIIKNIDGKELEVKFNSDTIEGDLTILNNMDSINVLESSIFKNFNNVKYYTYEEFEVCWNVIDYEVYENGNTIINKCYFRDYHEGKVVLINFKYDEGKFKPSMEVVFEEIVNNFR